MKGFKAEIVGHQINENKKVSYLIKISDDEENCQKTAAIRFREIQEIHHHLEEVISRLKLHTVLPKFPNHRSLWFSSKSEASIEERKAELSTYLNSLLKIQAIHSLDVVRKHYLPSQSQGLSARNSKMNIRISINRYQLVEDVVVYFITVRDMNSGEQWTCKARYRELRKIHQALQEGQVKNLPPFPKKKLFGSTSDGPETIENRRQALEILQQIQDSEAICYLVDESKKQAEMCKQLKQGVKSKQVQNL